MKSAVLDTNVLISALGWEGNERRLLRFASQGRLMIVTSSALLAEFKRMALHPKFDFTEAEVEEFFDGLIEVASVVEPNMSLDITRDPKDNMVLECALEGRAEYVISGDNDLLSLDEFKDIRIVTAKEFLESI